MEWRVAGRWFVAPLTVASNSVPFRSDVVLGVLGVLGRRRVRSACLATAVLPRSPLTSLSLPLPCRFLAAGMCQDSRTFPLSVCVCKARHATSTLSASTCRRNLFPAVRRPSSRCTLVRYTHWSSRWSLPAPLANAAATTASRLERLRHVPDP